MSTPSTTTHHPSRCFSYPQGEISLMPQFMALLALFSTLMAFPAFHFGNGSANNFICYELNSVDDLCVPLTITSPLFWQQMPFVAFKDDDWATLIKFAAVLGIVAAGLGFLAFCLLVTTSCFALTSKRLKQVVYCQAISAVLSMMTLLAWGADPCRLSNSENVYDPYGFVDTPEPSTVHCTKEQTRLDTGAVFMIFASVLHFIGLFLTFGYHDFVVKEETDALARATEKEKLALTTGQAVGEEQPRPSGTNAIDPANREMDA